MTSKGKDIRFHYKMEAGFCRPNDVEALPNPFKKKQFGLCFKRIDYLPLRRFLKRVFFGF